MEKTFVMVKPDGVQRQLIGDILARFERKGLQLIGAKLMNVSEETAGEHYKEHKENRFLVSLLTLLRQALFLQWYGRAKTQLR